MSKRGVGEDAARQDGAQAKVQACPAASPVGLLGAANPAEALYGSWKSEKGECKIGKDPVTARLSYTEPLEDGMRVHGWLDPVKGEENLWQGSLALLEKGKGPWYGPAFGPAPEIVGDIRVKLLSDPKSMETRIKMKDEDKEFGEPTSFKLESSDAGPMAMPNLSKILPMTQSDDGEQKEQGDQKRVRN
eukprot:TRINITY_DN6393_c0_g1_i1.p1 TRINITY_DN6393_c0_g1~~TRINITY_DN6393_c0_g1_i1.p1  ORF type:complete len:189 (-),score=49.46 TRINITY_DN6393_c0_g1_i1:150-716(-)